MTCLIGSRDLRFIPAMAFALALMGCSGRAEDAPSTVDGGSLDKPSLVDSGYGPLDPFLPPDQKVILGRVVDGDGNGIRGAKVTYEGGGTGIANRDGYYFIAEVAPADRIVLGFSAPGYIGTTGIGKLVAKGKAMVNAVMRVRFAGQPVDGIAGGAVVFKQGRVRLPPNAITDSLGKPFQGRALVHLTPIDIQAQGASAAPGDFRGIGANGQPTQLETFSMASFELRDESGNPLRLAVGAEASVEMLLPPKTPLLAGEHLPAWYFDHTTGLWVEQEQWVIGVSSADPTRLSSRLNLGRWADWTLARPVEATCQSGTVSSTCDGQPVRAVDCGDDPFASCQACLQGRVVDSAGKPVAASVHVKTGVNTLTVNTDVTGHYCAPAALGVPTLLVANTGVGTGSATATANRPGTCPSCQAVADIVIGDSLSNDTSLDFSACPKDVGGVTLRGVRAEGAAPVLATLDTAWMDASRSSSGRYVLSFDVVASQNRGTAFAPQARFELDLPDAPTAGGLYEVKTVADSEYHLHGQAVSANGVPAGLASESFLLTTHGAAVGSGWIKLDQGFASAGERVKGSFALGFDASCAALSSSLSIKADFDSILHDTPRERPVDTDSGAIKRWQCSLFDLASSAIASGSQGLSIGAVQVVVDSVPMVSDNALVTAQYLWQTDQLKITYFGDSNYFAATVDHPTHGVNQVTGASLSLRESNDCYLTLKAGTVTIPNFAGADATRWMTGSFAIDFATEADSAGTDSVPVKITGQFGGPVCAGN